MAATSPYVTELWENYFLEIAENSRVFKSYNLMYQFRDLKDAVEAATPNALASRSGYDAWRATVRAFLDRLQSYTDSIPELVESMSATIDEWSELEAIGSSLLDWITAQVQIVVEG